MVLFTKPSILQSSFYPWALTLTLTSQPLTHWHSLLCSILFSTFILLLFHIDLCLINFETILELIYNCHHITCFYDVQSLKLLFLSALGVNDVVRLKGQVEISYDYTGIALHKSTVTVPTMAQGRESDHQSSWAKSGSFQAPNGNV